MIIRLPHVSHHETFRWFLPLQEHPEAHPKVQLEKTGVRSSAGYLMIVAGSFLSPIVNERHIRLWNEKNICLKCFSALLYTKSFFLHRPSLSHKWLELNTSSQKQIFLWMYCIAYLDQSKILIRPTVSLWGVMLMQCSALRLEIQLTQVHPKVHGLKQGNKDQP